MELECSGYTYAFSGQSMDYCALFSSTAIHGVERQHLDWTCAVKTSWFEVKVFVPVHIHVCTCPDCSLPPQWCQLTMVAHSRSPWTPGWPASQYCTLFPGLLSGDFADTLYIIDISSVPSNNQLNLLFEWGQGEHLAPVDRVSLKTA